AARSVVVLPNDHNVKPVADAAAEIARAEGCRVAVLPTRSPVQGLAALAVHDPDRRFDEDVIAMTAAAGATRWGEVTHAVREAHTSVGICRPGDVLGLVDGDVVTIGRDVYAVGEEVLDLLLAASGE